jgi:hypothetical protein
MCSVSNEVCTLLLLEKSFDRCIDIHKNKTDAATIINSAVVANGEVKRKCKWESDMSPKYTDSGIIYIDEYKMTHKGWKDKGIHCFNALSHQVTTWLLGPNCTPFSTKV